MLLKMHLLHIRAIIKNLLAFSNRNVLLTISTLLHIEVVNTLTRLHALRKDEIFFYSIHCSCKDLLKILIKKYEFIIISFHCAKLFKKIYTIKFQMEFFNKCPLFLLICLFIH